jgi:uncharacterized membrane protein YphA (DoxX/SURF4 family)
MKMLITALQWLCQLGAGLILLMAGLGKLQGAEDQIAMFKDLGMEPDGRVLIGICEVVAGAGLLHPLSAAYAALLGSAVLTGAALAHIGPLGSEGVEVFALTYTALLFVLVTRRSELLLSSSRRIN